MKNKLSLQAVVGLLIIGIAVTACGGRTTPTPAPIAQAPTVQIDSATLESDKTMSVCFSQTVALIARATGRDLTYTWSLDGNGQLRRQEGKGDEGSSNRYTAPATSVEEVVKVTVTDDLNQSATDQVIIQVVECASPTPTELPATDTPTPTDTPIPTPTELPVADTPPPTDTPILMPTPSPRLPCDNLTAPVVIRLPLNSSDLVGRITTPEHCKTGLLAASPISVGGTVEEVPEGIFLWLFVYAPNRKYYPQCNDAKEGRCGVDYAQGQWAVTAWLGREGCKDYFQLVLVATDSAANDSLTKTMMSWAAAEDYRGLYADEVPDGITELDSIEVETAGQMCP